VLSGALVIAGLSLLRW